MKTINLRGITESLSESEMKNVVGGLDVPMVDPSDDIDAEGRSGKCPTSTQCDGTRYCIVGDTHGYCKKNWLLQCTCQ